MRSRIWTYNEAREVLVRVKKTTERARKNFDEIRESFENTILPENRQEMLEDQMQGILNRWVSSIAEMGAKTRGLWLVDFDNGSGYFCWKLGEDDLLFEHSYEGGFEARHPISQLQSENDKNYGVAEDPDKE